MPERNRMLGEILIDMGCLTPDSLTEALEHQKTHNERLGDILVSLGYIQPEALTRALAEQFDMEIMKLLKL